jgi:hypothetical protein
MFKYKHNFLASVNNKRNVEIDSPASSGSQGNYVKFNGVPSLSLEAALTIVNSYPANVENMASS